MSDSIQNTIDQEMSCYKMLGELDQYEKITTSQISNIISCIREDLSSKIDANIAHRQFIHMSGDVDVGTMSISGELSIAKDVKVEGNFYALDHVLRVESIEEQDDVPSGNLVVAEADYIDLNAQGSKIAVDDDLIQISANYVQLCAENAVEVHSPLIEADKDISAANDIYATKHGLVGVGVDFSTGGVENFAVGHNHKFYGKESFAVHDEDIVGAVGFYWKAIDTTDHLIYLSRNQPVFNYAECSSELSGSKDNFKNKHPEYDVPYFGPRANSTHQDLFEADADIELSSCKSQLTGKYITIWNCKYDKYLRCFKVVDVLSNSVIKYEDVPGVLSDSDKQTIYRYNNYGTESRPTYSDNQYVVYFPDANQDKINSKFHATSTSFGCIAFGDGNTSLGYNSFTSGKNNRAEGNYSIALGLSARAINNNAFAWNGKDSIYTVSGNGQFGINPKGDINGFWIGEHPLSYYLSDISGTLSNEFDIKLDDYVSKMYLKSSLSDIQQIENINSNSQIDDMISAVIKIRDMLSSLYMLAQ